MLLRLKAATVLRWVFVFVVAAQVGESKYAARDSGNWGLQSLQKELIERD